MIRSFVKIFFSVKTVLLTAILLDPLGIFAQQDPVDSLQSVISSTRSDTVKINALNQLSEKLWLTGEYDRAMKLVDDAISIDKEIGSPNGFPAKKRRADSYIVKALVYWKQGNYPSALEFYFSALKLNEEIENKKGISRCLNNIGLIYFNQGNYDDALENYLRALKLREELKDRKSIAGSLNNIGEVYKVKLLFPEALDNFERSLRINREMKNNNWTSMNLNNIGGVYYEMGELLREKKEDAATVSSNFSKALDYYKQALTIRKETDDRQGIARTNISLGLVNTRLKKYDEAKLNFDEALKYSKMIRYKEVVKEGYRSLATLDSVKGKWQNAFEHHKLYILYKDSLINEENTKRSVKTQMNFEFEKKEHATRLEQEKKDAETRAEKKRQLIIIVSVSIVLLFVLILAVVIFRSLKQNQKQNKIITAQKEIVERQKKLVEEHQKEISDSINYAERIQRSFLATEKILNANLNEYFVFFHPKDVVSGDFYWAAELTSGKDKLFALVTADSTGHGVPGAIMSILNISGLEHAVEEMKFNSPSAILDHTRKRIIDRLKKDGSAEGGKDGMDCSCICFDFKNREMIYAAANNPVWIVRRKGEGPEVELIELKPDKMPVGKHDKDAISFTETKALLQKGDMIYTITDGMPDQFGGEKKKKFMVKKLKEVLCSMSQLSCSEQGVMLEKIFKDWKGEMDQVDDVTVIGLRVA